MRYLLCFGLTSLWCLVTIATTDKELNRRYVVMPTIVRNNLEEYNLALERVKSTDKSFEPIEMYMNLLHWRKVLETYNKSKSLPQSLANDRIFPENPLKFLKEANDLIEIENVNPEKCTRDGFEKYQVLLKLHKNYQTSLVPYIKYHKKRLGELCEQVMHLKEEYKDQ